MSQTHAHQHQYQHQYQYQYQYHYLQEPENYLGRIRYFSLKGLVKKFTKRQLPRAYAEQDDEKTHRPWVCAMDDGTHWVWFQMTSRSYDPVDNENRPLINGEHFSGGRRYTKTSYIFNRWYLCLTSEDVEELSTAARWESMSDPTLLNESGYRLLATYLQSGLASGRASDRIVRETLVTPWIPKRDSVRVNNETFHIRDLKPTAGLVNLQAKHSRQGRWCERAGCNGGARCPNIHRADE